MERGTSPGKGPDSSRSLPEGSRHQPAPWCCFGSWTRAPAELVCSFQKAEVGAQRPGGGRWWDCQSEAQIWLLCRVSFTPQAVPGNLFLLPFPRSLPGFQCLLPFFPTLFALKSLPVFPVQGSWCGAVGHMRDCFPLATFAWKLRSYKSPEQVCWGGPACSPGV